MNIVEVLEKYWGHKGFRPLQAEIIQSVMAGDDTLALLPTGGGKSVCFQVPALSMPGICLVISPLIALMKDQVKNLKSKGISVQLLISGMSYAEIDKALDECVYGEIKLLYLSPERLLSSLVKERIKRMNISLIAVDEAHCISQWGYDFRPSYLQIAELRALIPNVPVLALTASATPAVSIDIQKQLRFRNPKVFSKSFYRDNLFYSVIQEEDKISRIVESLNRIAGTSIVYVRTRKQASDIAAVLTRSGMPAGYYHAGLELKEREKIQDAWIRGSLRVIVATNAFGMGIDKPNVRSVIHYSPPQNLEAFYQEAGRAGRDEQRADAILLFNKADIQEAERLFVESFPPVAEIRSVYQGLADYYQTAIGNGRGNFQDFDLSVFCRRTGIKNTHVLTCLKILERNGLILLSDAVLNPPRVKLLVAQQVLNNWLRAYPRAMVLVQAMLRSYGGIFENDIRISEKDIQISTRLTVAEIHEELTELHRNNIVRYTERTELPQFCFATDRVDSRYLQINFAEYEQKKVSQRTQLDAILGFITNEQVCRNKVLLNYFGETVIADCHRCDVCLIRDEKPASRERLRRELLDLVQTRHLELSIIQSYFPECSLKDLIDAVRSCMDAGLIDVQLGIITKQTKS